MIKTEVQHCLEEILSYIELEYYAGYDPYDALNSPLLKALSCNKRFFRIAFIQVLKRFPFNIRPLLGIKKDFNPKGIGLFLWGYAKLYGIERKKEYLEKIDYFLSNYSGLTASQGSSPSLSPAKEIVDKLVSLESGSIK